MSDSRIPARVLTRFLGSGKTTLLDHVLTDAVVVRPGQWAGTGRDGPRRRAVPCGGIR